jgi:hypothetical protein
VLFDRVTFRSGAPPQPLLLELSLSIRSCERVGLVGHDVVRLVQCSTAAASWRRAFMRICWRGIYRRLFERQLRP